MSRGRYTDQEFDLLERLKHENKKLKRELKAARKMLDRYQVAEQAGLIEDDVILPSKKRQREQKLKELWSCHEKDCGGVLELVLIGNRYLRICNGCGKHTKTQALEDRDVEALMKRSIVKGG